MAREIFNEHGDAIASGSCTSSPHQDHSLNYGTKDGKRKVKGHTCTCTSMGKRRKEMTRWSTPYSMSDTASRFIHPKISALLYEERRFKHIL